MKNFKKYITLNLLSFSGYIFFALLLVFIYTFPETIQFICNSNENTVYEFAGAKLIAAGVLYVFTIVEFMIVSAFIFEFLIYKIRKTQPQIINIAGKYNKIHSFLFTMGILLSMFSLFVIKFVYEKF